MAASLPARERSRGRVFVGFQSSNSLCGRRPSWSPPNSSALSRHTTRRCRRVRHAFSSRPRSSSISGSRSHCGNGRGGSASCWRLSRRRCTPPMPRAGSRSTIRLRSKCGAAGPSLAKLNGAAPGGYTGPTAGRCRTTNARWRSRSRKIGRCGARRRSPSGRTAPASGSSPIPRRCATPPARSSAR